MKDIKPDDERLAALLGGRLEGPEREELLAHLLANEEDYQVFADTASILQEAEDEEAAQSPEAGEQVHHPPARQTVPPSVRGGARWPSRAIVAAVLVGLVVLGTVVTRRGAASAGNPVEVVALLEDPDSSLSDAWMNDPVRTGPRGPGVSGAAEAGALLTDLVVSIRAGDTANTKILAGKIQARFEPRPTPSSPIVQIAERAGEPASALLPLVEEQTERLSESPLERDYLQLGAWTEAARLAADRKDADFFRTGVTRTMLRRGARITRDNPAQREALEKVRATLGAGGTLPWPMLEGQLGTLMRVIAS